MPHIGHRLSLFIIAFLAGIPVALAQAPPPGTGALVATGFVRVIDGDTIETRINGNLVGIGVIGIRAARGNTPCGEQAQALMGTLTRSSGIRLEEDPTEILDGHKRRMYYVLTSDGRSIAQELVRAGLARANGKGRERNTLFNDEQEARRNNRGCINNFPVDKDIKKDQANTDRIRFLPFSSETVAKTDNQNAWSAADETSVASDTTIRAAGIAAALPTGFSQQTIARGFSQPTGFTFLPDGRILVAEKNGVVRLVKNGVVGSTPFIDLRSRVNAYWDHGLLGITADLNFAATGYVYLLFTYENDPENYSGSKTQQLLRVKAAGDVASTAAGDAVVILGKNVGESCNLFPAGSDCIPAHSPNHAIGALRFASNGALFVSIGDDTTYNVVDEDALRVQNKTVLTGKILRIDPATGAGFVTNPFYAETGDVNANSSKVWVYGLRNPFRFGLRAADNLPVLGDVGWNTWEEIDTADPGTNLGWPCYEGAGRQPGYEPLAACQLLYSQGTSAVRAPIYSYNHSTGGASVTGGAFYTGTAYPEQFRGAYFFGDYVRGWIRYLTVDSTGQLTGTPTDFGTESSGPVDIQAGPDTNLYYLAINAAELRQIRYTEGNPPPTAVASATPTSGLASLQVQFSSAGSFDPNGDTLQYSWNFGDGSAASTSPNPQHTYSEDGTYAAVLTVSDGAGGTSTAGVTITVGNRPPVPTITAPSSTLRFKVGDTITFSGSASDPDSGTLPPSALSWQINLQHCESGSCHVHPFFQTTGESGSFTVPDHGDNFYFQIILTASDSGGLTGTTSVEVHPQTVLITLATEPSGLQLVYGGVAGISPLTRTPVIGSSSTISAVSPQKIGAGTYSFTSWSDGGAQQHNILIGDTNATYAATFATSFTPVRVNAGGPSYMDPQGNVWAADTGFSGGSTFNTSNSIANTTTPALYQTERYHTGPLTYTFAVPNGTYTVILKFAEISFSSAGQRVFNIGLNGQTVATNFDVFAEAGGAYRAVDRSYTVAVTNGQIAIQFTNVISNPKISAIEIVQGGTVVSVSPSSVSLGPSATQQFTATVSGTINTAVTWSISPTVGTISTSGLYTAPSTITSQQTVTVTATSQADPTRSGSATVTLVPPTTSFQPIRVNAGGSSYTDPQGNVWAADTGFSGGAAFSVSNAIANTTTQPLYQSERWINGTLAYTFAVPNGTYAVTLKFAEIWFSSAGQRTFHIVLNGQTVAMNFDVFAAAGGAYRAIDRSYAVSVTNGQIAIQLTKVIENPKISAIEIVQGGTAVSISPTSASLGPSATQQFTATVSGTTNTAVTWSISPGVGTISTSGLYTAPSTITSQQTVTVTATSQADPAKSGSATVTLMPPTTSFQPIRVNAGGSSYTDPQGNVWAADTGFSGGAAFIVSNSIANTTTQPLYQSERWINGTLAYTFAVPNGTYAVTLKFAEIYFSSAGQRTFHIVLNGQTVAMNFDVFAAAGGAYRAIDRSYAVSVTNGQIAIQLTKVIENPKISAIEIVQGGTMVSVSPTSASLGPSATQQFTATVSGTTNTAVTWSISPGVGTISTSGLYTAPSTITSQQTVTVTATSQADPAKSGSATVTLTPPAAVTVSVSPTSASLGPSATQQFTATVSGTTNTAVTWSISPGVGTISTSGLYTAPSTITSQQTVTVTATSQADPAKSGSATVTLTPPAAVTVSVSPTSASLGPSATQQFTATVSGTTNTAVTWSISPGVGTISTSGLYTAPSTITSQQTVTVTATSQADPTRSGSATVTLVPPTTSFQPIRVNAGGSSYTDPQGNVWAADTGFSGGAAFSVSNAIANTTTQPLYQSERWINGTLAYTFAVPNGTYTVTLKFAEIWFSSAGQRVFNIGLNGQTVAMNFDVFAAAGGAYRAVDRSYAVSVTNGQIAIQLTKVVENPKISAIEIVQGGTVVSVSPTSASLGPSATQQFTATVSGTTNTAVTWSINPGVGTISTSGLYTAPSTITSQQTVTVTATSQADPTRSGSATVTLVPPTTSFQPIRVNAGGSSYTDPQGNVWAADTGFSGGAAFSVSNAIANTTTQPLYQSERWVNGTLAYTFAVPNGTYAVTLKFAEIWFSSAGQRTFHIVLNGQTVAMNFDVFAAAGGAYRAIDRSYAVSVTNGQIAIQLTKVIENPKISAIEIVQGGTVVSVSPTSASLGPSATQQFTATVSGTTNTAVTWSISPGVGTISTSGLYTAPSTITSQQTVTVTATSQADSTKSGSATVTLMPPTPVTVSVSPTSASLGPSATQQFTATVSGTTNTTVTWSISPGVGTISTSGLYTAPSTITSQQTVTVTATSQADPAKSGSATVTLIPPGSTSIFSWETRAPSPIGRMEAQGTVANGKLYVFGGFTTSFTVVTTRADVYDPNTNTWTQIADVPEPLTHSAVAVDGQTIYVIGGYVGGHPGPSSERVWKYDTNLNSWTAGPALPATRGAGAAARVGRFLYFFGGATRTAGQADDTDQPFAYRLALDGGTSWTQIADMPNPRNHLGGIAVNGKVYAIGGQHKHEEGSGNQVETDVYDPATNTWTRVADLPTPRGHIALAELAGRILVMGNGFATNEVTLYDPVTNVWLKLPALPEPRASAVAGVVNDAVIVTTGNPGNGVASTTTWRGVFTAKWERGPTMSQALGEVATGIIGKTLYVVGEGSSVTHAYNLSSGVWSSTTLAARPFPGNHHAAEVVNGKLYLFGGLGSTSEGKVQIYDPTTNTWSLGANMPFAAGSSASALISGEVFVAGGIVGSTSTAQAAAYNPATNAWRMIASMPQGVNHAASATDGSKLYVFGGRLGGNVVGNGESTVQVYDPTSNTWTSNLTGAPLAPLPQARGGMGKAVYIGSEFYVIGGETLNGPGATANNVYDRVDIYNPATNTWRLGTPMPTARHGIFPVAIGGRIYVAAGGMVAGHSSSNVLETYNVY